MKKWFSSCTRRRLLTSISVVVAAGGFWWSARSRNGSPRMPAIDTQDVSPPIPVQPGPWLYFSADEAAAVEAIVDRLIPADTSGPGGKEAGCAVFIDRQLAGAFGDSRRLYMRAPFASGTPSQGPQSAAVPRERYRSSLAALDKYCKATFSGNSFALLNVTQQDRILSDLENGMTKLPDGSGKAFFEAVLANTIEGFFADPIYGGNRHMIGWKLVGFPGARYDYRDHISRHNEPYPYPPVSIFGRSEWSS